MRLFVEIIFLAFLLRTYFFIIAIQSGTRSPMLLNSVWTGKHAIITGRQKLKVVIVFDC